jgi:hypothetical protein
MGKMPSLADLMEDYRNWRGRQEWQDKKGWEEFYGGDSEMQDRAERMMGGFGTGSHGVGGLAGMIKASHGSPHMFDKFDFTKIGTGEGAQAYGHGGYFAEGFDSPVAKSYKGAGSTAPDPSKDIVGWSRWMMGTGIDESNIASLLKNGGKTNDEIAQIINDANKDVGNLYNVELKWPDAAREASDPLGEHHLFEWHTPLDELSAKDAEIINPLLDKLRSQPNPSLFKNVQTAGDVIKYAQALKLNPAEKISKAGYPGIRYLDQGSRGQGAGTRNYVMFDDQFPNIVSRNGASLSDLLRR